MTSNTYFAVSYGYSSGSCSDTGGEESSISLHGALNMNEPILVPRLFSLPHPPGGERKRPFLSPPGGWGREKSMGTRMERAWERGCLCAPHRISGVSVRNFAFDSYVWITVAVNLFHSHDYYAPGRKFDLHRPILRTELHIIILKGDMYPGFQRPYSQPLAARDFGPGSPIARNLWNPECMLWHTHEVIFHLVYHSTQVL